MSDEKPTPAEPVDASQLRSALVRCHRIDAQVSRYSHDNAVDVIALADLLIAKGLITSRELGERRAAAEKQVLEQREREYVGPTLYPSPPPDAPRAEPVLVDCDARYAQCRAACCILYNVYLTSDEVMSGKYRWDLEHPYRLQRTPEGHCTYLDRTTLRCSIWADRPQVCRGYSCKSDKNIWADFDGAIGTGAARDKQPAPPPRVG